MIRISISSSKYISTNKWCPFNFNKDLDHSGSWCPLFNYQEAQGIRPETLELHCGNGRIFQAEEIIKV